MAKYKVNCSKCESTMEVALFGKCKDRERKLENYTWTCESCKAINRKEEGARAAEENASLGLPPLEGSEKQVAWAERIRKSAMEDDLTERVSTAVGRDLGKAAAEKLLTENEIKSRKQLLNLFDRMVADYLQIQTSASWFIDNRSEVYRSIAQKLVEKINNKESLDEMLEAKAVKNEAVIEPDCELITEAIAEIRIKEDRIEIELPEKIESFRLMIKSVGFRWCQGYWERCGEVLRNEAAVYVGQQALSMGIRIMVFDDAVLNGIRKQRGNACWITSTDTHAFIIWWQSDWYDLCKSLPSAHWKKPYIRVDLKYREEILDFAEREGFGITETTLARLNEPLKKETLSVASITQTPQPRPKLDAETFNVAESLTDKITD